MAKSGHDIFEAVHTDIAPQVLDLFHLPPHSPQMLGQLLVASTKCLIFTLVLANFPHCVHNLSRAMSLEVLGVRERPLVPMGDLVQLSLLGYQSTLHFLYPAHQFAVLIPRRHEHIDDVVVLIDNIAVSVVLVLGRVEG